MKAQVVRIGPPADSRHAEIFAPGSIAPSTVPVTRAFDSSEVIGSAEIRADGSAEITLAPGVDVGTIRHTGLGFLVLRSSIDGAGVRMIEELEPICLCVEFAIELPVVGGIGEAWASYLENIVPATAGDVQREEMKRAFYAGAAAGYEATLNAADLEEGAAAARLEAIDRELLDYIRLFKSREGI
jgi:hypothetical protein